MEVLRGDFAITISKTILNLASQSTFCVFAFHTKAIRKDKAREACGIASPEEENCRRIFILMKEIYSTRQAGPNKSSWSKHTWVFF